MQGRNRWSSPVHSRPVRVIRSECETQDKVPGEVEGKGGFPGDTLFISQFSSVHWMAFAETFMLSIAKSFTPERLVYRGLHSKAADTLSCTTERCSSSERPM